MPLSDPFDNAAPALNTSVNEVKAPVTVALATNLADVQTGLEPGDVIDGVTLRVGHRVLLAGQTTGSQNGLYEVQSQGGVRAADADVSAEYTPSFYVDVIEGTTQGGSRWQFTTSGAIVLGTTSLAFTKLTETVGQAAHGFAAFDNSVALGRQPPGYYNAAAASTANVNLAGFVTPTTIDGVLIDDADTLLLTAQTLPSENGLYTVQEPPVRITVSVQTLVTVAAGTVNGGKKFIVNVDNSTVSQDVAPTAIDPSQPAFDNTAPVAGSTGFAAFDNTPPTPINP